MLVLFSLDSRGLEEEGIWADFPKYMYFQTDGDSSQPRKHISYLWPAFLYIGASSDLL